MVAERSARRCAVSYGERQQEKRVLLLDKRFKLLESIPLHAGPRHHDLHWQREHAALQALPLGARDRVRVLVPPEAHEDAVAWKEAQAATGALKRTLRDGTLMAITSLLFACRTARRHASENGVHCRRAHRAAP